MIAVGGERSCRDAHGPADGCTSPGLRHGPRAVRRPPGMRLRTRPSGADVRGFGARAEFLVQAESVNRATPADGCQRVEPSLAGDCRRSIVGGRSCGRVPRRRFRGREACQGALGRRPRPASRRRRAAAGAPPFPARRWHRRRFNHVQRQGQTAAPPVAIGLLADDQPEPDRERL